MSFNSEHVWTRPEAVDLARSLIVDHGWPASRVAAKLSGALGVQVNRNAVIGKAHRMGWAFRQHKGRTPSPLPAVLAVAKPSRRARTRPSAPSTTVESATILDMTEEKIAPVDHATATTGRSSALDELFARTPLMQLRRTSCRWPIGDVKAPGFRFCADATIADGRPYCPHHTRVASGGAPAPPKRPYHGPRTAR